MSLSLTLRFSPNVLTHLGEALVPNADQAILELVKNAFDADARSCYVEITAGPNGSILVVRDDGRGMTIDELRNGWLLLGSSNKSRSRKTKRFGRLPVGDKGLGRLAALRLGKTAEISTRARGSHTYSLVFDWSEYRAARAVDDVRLSVTESNDNSRVGTTITVKGCPAFDRGDLQRIGRALAIISDPFETEKTFKVSLGGELEDANTERFERRLFPYASYRLTGRLDDQGRLVVRLNDRNNKLVARETIEKVKYDTVPFRFELWEFRLKRDSYSAADYPLEDVRAWIKRYGGVHVFDGPIRIAPYGDRPVDWLDMNLMRASSPEHRPSTNNSIGRVVIDNSSGRIAQTTDRISFIENGAYEALRSACRAAIAWASSTRRDIADTDRVVQRTGLEDFEAVQRDTYDVLKSRLTPVQYKAVEPVIRSAFAAASAHIDTLRTDVVLYRAMATAGITAAVFSHEIGHPIGLFQRQLPKVLKACAGEPEAAAAAELLRQAAERVEPYIRLPGRFASTARRRISTISIGLALQQAMKIYMPILDEHGIGYIDELKLDGATVRASNAMIDAILANFITNSVTAFRREVSTAPPKVRLAGIVARDEIVIRYADNGGGLSDVEEGDIWKPGVSTTPGGTGFGLTIVRDTAHDLGGEVAVTSRSDFGGAEFTVRLPLMPGR